MNIESVIEKLRAMGSEKNRQNMLAIDPDIKALGVSETRLKQLAGKIGKNPLLAEKLWHSGIPDAQFLACCITDPALFNSSLANQWAEQIRYYPLAEVFIQEIIKPAGLAPNLMKSWLTSENIMIRRMGYLLLADSAKNNKEMENEFLLNRLYEIEKQIHSAPDLIKEAMHKALIAIGERNKILNTEALIIGMRIGPVIIRRSGKDETLPDAFKILGNKKLKERLKKSDNNHDG